MKWKDKLVEDIFISLKEDPYWTSLFNDAVFNHRVNIHLAIFNEPFLTMLFTGEKTMESRFSINNIVPYNRIAKYDIVLVKKSGGGIVAVFRAKTVCFFSNLTEEKVSDIERKFGKYIGWGVDPEFLCNKKDAKYLSLIEIMDLKQFNPIGANKSDRTAWAILKLGLTNTLFGSQIE
jgi:hypothetical protein